MSSGTFRQLYDIGCGVLGSACIENPNHGMVGIPVLIDAKLHHRKLLMQESIT